MKTTLRQLRRPLRHQLVRFLLVGGCGELLYLALFALVGLAGGSATAAVALAGAISLLLNAVLHARYSFRVPFRLALLGRYAAIQLGCLGLSLAAAWALQHLGIDRFRIALITMVLWAATSFVLTRLSYRSTA
ncbi:MAG: GtrA family protein [Cyanobium sp.]